jgi:Na+-translocating ferredoxin:NAD+ oxidoreductase RnfC subunit
METRKIKTSENRIDILKRISQLGLVGAGGAGFPTHIKLNCEAEIVIANGAECEPLMHKDKELIAAHPDMIIAGLQLALQVTGAKEGIIAIKEKAESAIAALASRVTAPLKMKMLRDTYPAGDEFVLTYEMTGRIPPAGGLPIHVGVVVSNVETLYWLGKGEPVTEKWLTVAGQVPKPGTFKIPIGISVREVLKLAGITNVDGFGILAGGAMMGSLLQNADSPVTKTLGGLIVLPLEHALLKRFKQAQNQRYKIARSACDQCNFCTQLCPRYLLGHPVEPHLAMRHLGMAPPGSEPPSGCQYCCGCQLCTLWSCPEDLSPGVITFEYRNRIKGHSAVEKKLIEKPHPMYDYRKPSISVLKRRLGLDIFADHAPIIPMSVKCANVSIPLKQHIGVEAEPVIKVGSSVEKNQLIAKIPDGKMGSNIHASIDGIITEITDCIKIEKR